MRLDKFYNLPQMSLDKAHNPIVPRTDLGIDSGIKLAYKLAKSLIKTSSKLYKPKTCDEVIDNPIYKKKQCKAIDKELWNLDSYQA